MNAAYVPDVSAMPRIIGVISCQPLLTYIWLQSYEQFQPPPTAILTSAVMPAVASAITCAQFTAARSAGDRATPARRRAFHEWANCTNCACDMPLPAIQLDGSGKAA